MKYILLTFQTSKCSNKVNGIWNSRFLYGLKFVSIRKGTHLTCILGILLYSLFGSVKKGCKQAQASRNCNFHEIIRISGMKNFFLNSFRLKSTEYSLNGEHSSPWWICRQCIIWINYALPLIYGTCKQIFTADIYISKACLA